MGCGAAPHPKKVRWPGICVFAALYGSNVLLPQMVQSLFGYDAYKAGLILSPGGVVTMIGMPIAGYLLGRRVDARWLIIGGLLGLGCATWWMSQLNLQVAPETLVLRRCAQVAGMAFIFVPINTAAYLYIPEEQHANATALFNVVRNEGASLGIALVSTLVARRSQFHHNRLGEHFQNDWDQLAWVLQTAGHDAGTARQMALGQLYARLQQQALSLAYFDLFWLFALMAFAVIPLVLLMRRSVSEKGAAARH